MTERDKICIEKGFFLHVHEQHWGRTIGGTETLEAGRDMCSPSSNTRGRKVWVEEDTSDEVGYQLYGYFLAPVWGGCIGKGHTATGAI